MTETYLAVPVATSFTSQLSFTSSFVIAFPDNLVFPFEFPKTDKLLKKIQGRGTYSLGFLGRRADVAAAWLACRAINPGVLTNGIESNNWGFNSKAVGAGSGGNSKA